jgi:hypothetical protein
LICSSTDESEEQLAAASNATASDFLFCFNFIMLQKVHQQNSAAHVSAGGLLVVMRNIAGML